MDETRPPVRIDPDLEAPASGRVTAPPPEEFTNPPGVGGEECEPQVAPAAEPCDPSAIEDLVLEESMPGTGIEGYEGEEVGGG